MSFNFLPPDYQFSNQLLDSLRQISNIEEEAILQLAGIIMNYLQTPSLQPKNFINQLNNVPLSLSQAESISTSLILFFQFATKRTLSKLKVREDLQSLGLSELISQNLSEMWDQNKLLIYSSTLGMHFNYYELQDIQWKFGVTVANGQNQAQGQCFIQVKLVVDGRNAYFEMSPSQFYQFYGELEKIKSIMDINT